MTSKTFVQNSMQVNLFSIIDNQIEFIQELNVHPNMFVIPVVGSTMHFMFTDYSGLQPSANRAKNVGTVLSVEYHYNLVLRDSGAALDQSIDILLVERV